MWLLAMSPALAACETEEMVELNRIQRRANLELAELSEIASNLPEREREWQILESHLALHCAPETPEALRSGLEQHVPGARASVQRKEEPLVWLRLEGDGPAVQGAMAVESLAEALPFLSLEQVSTTSAGWILGLRAEGPCPLPDPTVVTHYTLPREGWLRNDTSQRMRAELAITERRIRELQKVLGRTAHLNALKLQVERAMAVNGKRADRIRQQQPLVEALFGVPGALTATLKWEEGAWRLEGRFPTGDAAWTKRLAHAGYRVVGTEAGRMTLASP